MTTSTTARLLALYDEARSLGYPDRSARTYAANRVAVFPGYAGRRAILEDLLADRAAGRTGSTLVRTAANAAPEVL